MRTVQGAGSGGRSLDGSAGSSASRAIACLCDGGIEFGSQSDGRIIKPEMLFKPADQITEVDLTQLVQGRATEDERLEFKREMYGHSDGQIAEMIRDIVALANHRGGLILIGVEEDGDGVATGLPGITGTGHVERITSSTQANVARRLRGLQVVPIPLANGQHVIAIGVPESMNRPHMTTFRGENRFWRREIRQRVMMSVDEIERALMNRIDGATRVEDFMEDSRLWSASFPMSSTTGRILVLQAAPAFMHEEIVDVRDPVVLRLLERPSVHPQSYQLGCDSGTPRPSLHGLAAEARDDDGRLWSNLELWREGYMEFRGRDFMGHPALSSREQDSVPSVGVLLIVFSFVHLYRALMDHFNVATPAAFGLTLVNARGCHISIPDNIRRRPATRVWEEAHVKVPFVYAQDVASEADDLIRRLNDRLWNAFGFESCKALRDDGSIIDT